MNKFNPETWVSISDQMVDITKPQIVEIQISNNGVIWVNVDGICRLRCCRIEKLVIDDQRVIYPTPVED